MTPRIVSHLGLCLLIGSILVLSFSIWRSMHDVPSMGLASLGTLLLLLGIAMRVRARRAFQ